MYDLSLFDKTTKHNSDMHHTTRLLLLLLLLLLLCLIINIMHTCMHACMHTYKRTYIHTYIYMYICIYIYIYISCVRSGPAVSSPASHGCGHRAPGAMAIHNIIQYYVVDTMYDDNSSLMWRDMIQCSIITVLPYTITSYNIL